MREAWPNSSVKTATTAGVLENKTMSQYGRMRSFWDSVWDIFFAKLGHFFLDTRKDSGHFFLIKKFPDALGTISCRTKVDVIDSNKSPRCARETLSRLRTKNVPIWWYAQFCLGRYGLTDTLTSDLRDPYGSVLIHVKWPFHGSKPRFSWFSAAIHVKS